MQGELTGLRHSVRAAQTNSGKLVGVVHETVRRQDREFQHKLDQLRDTLEVTLKPLKEELGDLRDETRKGRKETREKLSQNQEETREKLSQNQEETRKNTTRMESFISTVGTVGFLFSTGVAVWAAVIQAKGNTALPPISAPVRIGLWVALGAYLLVMAVLSVYKFWKL